MKRKRKKRLRELGEKNKTLFTRKEGKEEVDEYEAVISGGFM